MVVGIGQCKGDPGCDCDDKEDLVCGKDGLTYRNYCFAKCSNVLVNNLGPCAKECPRCDYTFYDPVCGEDRRWYKNECIAKCHDLRIAKDWWCDGAYHRLPY